MHVHATAQLSFAWLDCSFLIIYSRESVIRRSQYEHLTALLIRYPNRKASIRWVRNASVGLQLDLTTGLNVGY